MTNPEDEITPISADKLSVTWLTLTTLMDNYNAFGIGWEELLRAKRLVEIEIRSQHGDEVWAQITDQTIQRGGS